MYLRSICSVLIAGTIVSVTSIAQSQIPSNFNHPVNGITVLSDGTDALNPDAFGFTTGSTLTFVSGGNNAATGTYALASVRAFDLLNLKNSADNWAAQDTAAIGSLAFGSLHAWQPESLSGKSTGWEDSLKSQGPQKAGNIGPNDSTGLVFEIRDASTQALRRLNNNELPTTFGFDVGVFIGQGQTDPFGNGLIAGQLSTGRVLLSNSPQLEPVPEPGSLALFTAVGVTGAGFFVRKRRSIRK